MLNKEDKKWIELKIDGKINQAKLELRDEIITSEARLEGKIEDVKTQLDDRIDGVESRLEAKIDGVESRLEAKIDESSIKLKAVMETEFRHFMSIVSECMPDSVRSYEKIQNSQRHHEDDLAVLKTVVSNHESRISRLEA